MQGMTLKKFADYNNLETLNKNHHLTFADGFNSVEHFDCVSDVDAIGSDKKIVEINNLNIKRLCFTDDMFIEGVKLNDELTKLDKTKTLRFIDCHIEHVTFENFNLEEMPKIEFVSDELETTIDNVLIINSTFYSKLYFNQSKNRDDDIGHHKLLVKTLEIKNSVFKQNFKLHNSSVNQIRINNVDFEENADFYKSNFVKGIEHEHANDIVFKSVVFKKLALFGETVFDEKLIFKYATFEGYNHFKSAQIKKGLDLEYTNIQKEINFYGINIDKKSETSQETYRIIKNQFEKLGNKIEANRYYSCELEKRREYLKLHYLESKENFLSYIVFTLHNLTSEHSRDWFLVLMWIFNVGCFTYLYHDTSIPSVTISSIFAFALFISIICFSAIEGAMFFMTLSFILLGFFEVSFELKCIIKYTSILRNNTDEDFSLVLFANKLALGYLYYQFIIAVRKDTMK